MGEHVFPQVCMVYVHKDARVSVCGRTIFERIHTPHFPIVCEGMHACVGSEVKFCQVYEFGMFGRACCVGSCKCKCLYVICVCMYNLSVCFL